MFDIEVIYILNLMVCFILGFFKDKLLVVKSGGQNSIAFF